MYRKLKDYFRAPEDYITFVSVLYWAVRLEFFIRRRGLMDLIKLLTPRRTRRGHRARRIVVFVNWWLNRNIFMLRPTCLRRSLLLYRFLTREGLPVRIHYGIKKTSDRSEGHSWLTLDDRPFLQDGLIAESYKETLVFPPNADPY